MGDNALLIWFGVKEDKTVIMSDDEYDRMSNTSQTSMKGDEAFAKRKAGLHKNELNEQLKEYITQWRDERSKEEEELKRLKDKQAKRKEIRAEQEKELDAMDSDELKMKANKIWESIVTLETDKYDYEQRKLDQDYELKELKERQKLQMRNKAVKKGLDPEAFTGAHPPRIHMFSKYERRT